MKECIQCKQQFETHSAYRNHIRWSHRDNTEYFKKTKERLTLKKIEKEKEKEISKGKQAR